MSASIGSAPPLPPGLGDATPAADPTIGGGAAPTPGAATVEKADMQRVIDEIVRLVRSMIAELSARQGASGVAGSAALGGGGTDAAAGAGNVDLIDLRAAVGGSGASLGGTGWSTNGFTIDAGGTGAVSGGGVGSSPAASLSIGDVLGGGSVGGGAPGNGWSIVTDTGTPTSSAAVGGGASAAPTTAASTT